MPEGEPCPVCGGERPAGSPPGICPRCLAGIERLEPGPAGQTGTDPGPAGPIPDADFTTDGPDVRPDLPAGARVLYLGDYEIRRELGRGGMGVVYAARQISLNRPVALKLVRSGILAEEDDLRRFRNEAEALALLDHPGLVPVYEVGEHEGLSYLAMKLVDGGNLAERLGRYRDDPRAAALLVAEAAEAVHHAHMRGVLHRDLKPANILVDPEGRPHVTDFGLAKRVEDDLEMTATGAILGTPAYMSPEQASGRRGAVTTATDVYGLGAVLYALLAGRAPFGGRGVLETLDAVRTRPPEPPSRFNPGAARDLETVALKCLEKDPRRRYASAHALAEDLRAWLDSRPIAARRVGPAERAWLWCRRKPAVAALAATALLAIVAGAAATIAVQARANAALTTANARGKQRFDLALESIRYFHGEVSEDLLLKEKQFEGLRNKLLRAAAGFYGRLEDAMRDERDPESRAALGRALFELGLLTEQIGDNSGALVVLRRALAIRPASSAPDGESSAEEARLLIAIGRLQASMRRTNDAIATLRRARSLAAQATSKGGPTDAARIIEAETLRALAGHLSQAGRLPEAEAVARAGLAQARAQVEAAPGDVERRNSLAAMHSDLGKYEMYGGRTADALTDLDGAKIIQQDLAAAFPGDDRFRRDLAATEMRIGVLHLQQTGRPAFAAAALEKAKGSLQSLVAANPAVTQYRRLLLECEQVLSSAWWSLGRVDRCLEVSLEARDLARSLLDANPEVVDYRRFLSGGYGNAGMALAAVGRLHQALEMHRLAIAIDEADAVHFPENPDLRLDCIVGQVNLSEVLRLLGRAAEAREAALRGVDMAEAVVRENPEDPLYQARVAFASRQLALSQLQLGEMAPAVETARRAIALLEKAPEVEANYAFERACCHAILAGVAETPGSGLTPEEGRNEAERAMEDLHASFSAGFRNSTICRSERALDSLRLRGDFRGLLLDMDFPDDPFSP